MARKLDIKLKTIVKVWQLQLNLEHIFANYNTRLSFKDIGAFCELLAGDYNEGFIGGGSGGMGVDLYNNKTHKCVEVKSCCTIQNAVCKNCQMKFNDMFLSACPKCGSKNYRVMKDSRFGIDAKEFLRLYNDKRFENFTLCYISLIVHNKTKHTITIHMEWFKIEFNDDSIVEKQLQYFKNQVNLGRKPHCNLLPYSYDFYKLAPRKIDDIQIVINYDDINTKPIIKHVKFSPTLLVPINVIPKIYKKAFENLKTYVKGKADILDFAKNMEYKKKSLGKKRGNTRKKVDKIFE